jgi:hypothetical protein
MTDSHSDPPAHIAEMLAAIERAGMQPDQLAEHIARITDRLDTHEPLRRLSTDSGLPLDQLALYLAARQHKDAVAGLPVAAPVRKLLEDEFASILTGKATPRSTGQLGTSAFSATCKIVTLRRMPAGCMDWEIDGFPRSWLLRVPRGRLAPTLWFLLARMRGFRPFYFMHVARKPRNRGLVIEREVMRSYWRMAASIERQPEMKGLIAAAWFHDTAAIASHPHLEWLNRPYLRDGGFITDTGEAPPDSGFAEHNRDRAAAVERGELKFRMGVALWPRDAMIRWANSHPEYGE